MVVSKSISAATTKDVFWLLALCFLHFFPLSAPSFLLQDGSEGQLSAEEEEARRIAEMGKPILGEHSRLEVVIEESYEFKVHLHFFLFAKISSVGFVPPQSAAGCSFTQDQS